MKESLLRERLMASLAGPFGALAVVLTALGLYGVTSYAVVQRTHEIGIRMALGADRRSVVALILQEAAAVTIAALLLALVAAGASYLPARRAASVDPVIALRQE